MSLDQIDEQNNELIKGCRGASDLLDKVNDSDLIHWETCSLEFVVEYFSLNIVWIIMRFLLSRV